MAVAHFNLARLRALPGDPAVAEFVDNTARVNAIAEASPGFHWRWSEEAGEVKAPGSYEGIAGDRLLVASLSVWESAEAFGALVYRSDHGAFFRRRAEWFEPLGAANYVLWRCAATDRPSVDEGLSRLERLRREGPGDEVMDLRRALGGAA